jgi:hypothetical protein
MKQKLKFFSGLSLGLILGFVLFNVNPSFSKESQVNASIPEDQKGNSITSSQASTLEAEFKQNFIAKNELHEKTSYGGVISKSNLNDITGWGADDLIQFKFYHKTGSEGEDQIGLIFYKKADGSSTIIQTGPGSFCPVMCE